MSITPMKYVCDADECGKTLTHADASSHGWYYVVFSREPKYAMLCWFGAAVSEKTTVYHACGLDHALKLLADAALAL